MPNTPARPHLFVRKIGPISFRYYCLFVILVITLPACHKNNPAPVPVSYRAQVDITFINGNHPQIQMNIGGKTVNVTFDTGSSGLRILKGALDGASYTTLNTRIGSGYGGGSHGLNLSGLEAEATFSFSSLKSQQPIPFMLIDDVQYKTNDTLFSWIQTKDEPSLPVSDSNSYPNFSANLGVGMRMDATVVGSPITQMPGAGQYIVHFPNAGQTKGGYVIFNPNAADLAKFKNAEQLNPGSYLLPNGNLSYIDTALNGTLTINGVPFARNTLLDSGNPAVWTESLSFKKNMSFNSGPFTMAIGANPVLADTTIQASNAVVVEENYNSKYHTNSFGAPFFFLYDVLFDAKKGQIWIAKK